MTPTTPSAGTRPKRRHIVRWLIALSIVALLLWLMLRPHGEKGVSEVPPIVTVQTAMAEVRTFAVTLGAIGTVTPRPGHAAQLAAPAATIILSVYVGTGDRVTAGQPLVALDASVFAAQTQQAEAAFRTAELAYARAVRLVGEGILPRKDEETAASELATARAALVDARRRQAGAVLRSPIAGVVTRLNATLSQSVDLSQPLVEIVDPAALEVRFHLSAQEAARISPGQAVRLTGGPDSSNVWMGNGTVRGVSAAIDSMTGSVDVRVTLASTAAPLRVGESVNGEITIVEHPGAVVVPLRALVPAGSGAQVFVLDARNIAHATPVTVGARSDTEAEILAGLRGGETVVTEGAYGVTDGARVERAKAP